MSGYEDDVSYVWRMTKDTTLYFETSLENQGNESQFLLAAFHWQPYECVVLWKLMKSYLEPNDKCKLFFSFFFFR